MKRAVFFVTAFFALTLAINANGIAIGEKVENFKMMGTDKQMHSLESLMGKNGAVIIFLSAKCPVVKAYIERINSVAADYKAKGINFIGINSNNRNAESLEWVTSDAKENFSSFPMLIDEGNVLADRLGATVTPEVYYVNTKNVLLYHGAIDNDRSGRNITDPFLRTAFDQSLSGKAIERSTSKAFGCEIKRVGDKGKGRAN